MEQEELRDNQEQDPTPESPVTQYIYYILRFSNIQQAVAFSKTVTYPVDTSELYKMGSEYYLTVLIDTENQPINILPGYSQLFGSMRMIQK